MAPDYFSLTFLSSSLVGSREAFLSDLLQLIKSDNMDQLLRLSHYFFSKKENDVLKPIRCNFDIL